MAKKKKYTKGQRNAYQSGMGYSIAHKGKKIAFSSEEMKELEKLEKQEKQESKEGKSKL